MYRDSDAILVTRPEYSGSRGHPRASRDRHGDGRVAQSHQVIIDQRHYLFRRYVP